MAVGNSTSNTEKEKVAVGGVGTSWILMFLVSRIMSML
jgi:hypothetical protein